MRFIPLIVVATLLAGCSSSSSPTDPGPSDTTPPVASSFVQDRDLDPTGRTVTVTFSEAVAAVGAEDAGLYTLSGGVSVTAATLRSGGEAVDLQLDGLALPGSNTITIAAGIEDAAGNAFVGVSAQPIVSTDNVAPLATALQASAPPGPENDTLMVTFDDDMVPSDVEEPAKGIVESQLGEGIDITGAIGAHNGPTRSARDTLGARAGEQNRAGVGGGHVVRSRRRL